MATAQQLVSCAQGCGFRESGVTGSRRYIAGLRCSLRLEVQICRERSKFTCDAWSDLCSMLQFGSVHLCAPFC